jgi:DNA-binding NtrC family response regulator
VRVCGSAGEASVVARIEYLKTLVLSILSGLDSLNDSRRAKKRSRLDFQTEVRRFESELIRNALRIALGSQPRAAAILGISTEALNLKIKRLRIEINDDAAVTSAAIEDEQTDFDWTLRLNEAIARLESELICRALAKTRGHQVHAARLLQLRPTTLHWKLQKLGINPNVFRTSLPASSLTPDGLGSGIAGDD